MAISFDLGGFLGGIFGTLGAFGVAFVTFRREERLRRPSVQKVKMECLISVETELRKLYLEIPNIEDEMTFEEARTYVAFNVIAVFEKLLPPSYEAGKEVYLIVLNTLQQISKLVQPIQEDLEDEEVAATSEKSTPHSKRLIKRVEKVLYNSWNEVIGMQKEIFDKLKQT